MPHMANQVECALRTSRSKQPGSYCRTSLSEVGRGDISTPETLEFLKGDDVGDVLLFTSFLTYRGMGSER